MSGRRQGRRGEGWISERQGVLYVHFKHGRRHYSESARTSLRGVAQKQLDQLRRAVLSGTYIPPKKRPKPGDDSLAKLAQRWLDSHVTGLTPKGQKITAKVVQRYLIPGLGGKPVPQITGEDVWRYRKWLEAYRTKHDRKLSAQSVAHILSDCRCMFLWAQDQGAVVRSPFPRRIMPKVQKLPPRGLSEEEANRVAALHGAEGFACRLGLGCGARWGELVRLTGESLVDGALVIVAPKTKTVRRVPVPPELQAEIRLHGKKPLLPFEQSDVHRFVRAVRHLSGVRTFGAHRLRHTYAMRWLAQGGNLGALQIALGHSSILTTMKYAKPTEELLRHEAERMWAAQAHEA